MTDREAFEEYWGDASVLEAEAWVIWQAATLAERERAAKVCEGIDLKHIVDHDDLVFATALCFAFAAAIRKGPKP